MASVPSQSMADMTKRGCCMLDKEVAAVKVVERLPWRRLSIVLDGTGVEKEGWRRNVGGGKERQKKRWTNKHNERWTV